MWGAEAEGVDERLTPSQPTSGVATYEPKDESA